MWPNQTLGMSRIRLMELYEFCKRLMPAAFILVSRCDQSVWSSLMLFLSQPFV